MKNAKGVKVTFLYIYIYKIKKTHKKNKKKTNRFW